MRASCRERLAGGIFGKEKRAPQRPPPSRCQGRGQLAITAELGEGQVHDVDLNVGFEDLQYKSLKNKVPFSSAAFRAGRRDAQVPPSDLGDVDSPPRSWQRDFPTGRHPEHSSITSSADQGTQDLDALTGGVKSTSSCSTYNFTPVLGR